MHAVVYAYKRDDDGEDPQELQASDEEHTENCAVAAHRLLEKLRCIPGRNKDGELDLQEIEKWVHQVRAGCKELAREKICDHMLGKLFSTVQPDEDDVWPCQPVGDALENIMSKALSDILQTALYNARGIHFRGEGGNDERRLVEQFKQNANALEYTHPKISRALMRLAENYKREAEYQDTDFLVRRRLRH